jgi:hypothetical protein
LPGGLTSSSVFGNEIYYARADGPFIGGINLFTFEITQLTFPSVLLDYTTQQSTAIGNLGSSLFIIDYNASDPSNNICYLTIG